MPLKTLCTGCPGSILRSLHAACRPPLATVFLSNLHLSFSIKAFLFELIISIIHALKMLLKRHDSCLISFYIADSASLQPHSHFFMPLQCCEAFQTLPSSNPSTRSPPIPHLSDSPNSTSSLCGRSSWTWASASTCLGYCLYVWTYVSSFYLIWPSFLPCTHPVTVSVLVSLEQNTQYNHKIVANPFSNL